jgi:hypothetical protein
MIKLASLKNKNRFVQCLLIVFLLAPILVQSVKAQENNIPEYEDLVLAVISEREFISPGIFAIEQNGKYFLPIGELGNVFGIYTNRQGAEVSGFIFNENNSFAINTNDLTIKKDENVSSVPEGAFLDIGNNELYVDVEVIPQIWPVDLEVKKASLTLNVTPDKDLPFKLLRGRENRRLALDNKEEEENLKNAYRPFLAYPYRLFSKPDLSITGNIEYREDRDQKSAGLTVGGTQDLLYAQADYTTSLRYIDDELIEPEAIRLRFRRQNIHEGALPFGLEQVDWGDVGLGSRDLIGSSASGRGATFSTNKNDYTEDFDIITVDGIGTPGWETELYVNGELIDFGEVQSDGVYSFDNVRIRYGNNAIRIVFYGPQGQIVERKESYSYKTNALKAGERLLNGGIVDQNERLIPIDDRDDFRAEGIGASLYAAQGITDNLTAFASANIVNDNVARESIRSEYISAGAIGTFDNFATQAELYKQLDGGTALDARVLSSFKGIRFNAQASFFQDFESDFAGRGTSAKKFEFDFDARKTIATAIGAIGLQGQLNFNETENGDQRLRYTTRQSYSYDRFRFANNLRTVFTNGERQSTRGTFTTSTFFNNKFSLRNNLDYNIYPDAEIVATDLNLRYRYRNEYSASLGLQQNFLNDTTSASVLVSKDFEKFTGSAGVTWSSDTGPTVLLRANTSLTPFGPDGEYVATAGELRNASPISAFTFRDLDYDGVYSEGDEPIEGSKVVINDKINKHETGENGFMYDANVANNRLTTVRANPESIDDPYLVPSHPGYEIYPRPGVVHRIALPLVETGAIDGSVRYADGVPVAGLDIELMDIDGEILKRTTTAPDGYFTFEQVMPGDYTIRAAPDTGATIPFKYVSLTPDDLFKFGEDILVVDLLGGNSEGLNIAVDDKGQMNVKNILTLAKKSKSKDSTTFKEYKRQKPTGATPTVSQAAGQEVDTSLLNRILSIEPAAGEEEQGQFIEVSETAPNEQVFAAIPLEFNENDRNKSQKKTKVNAIETINPPVSATSTVTNVRIGQHSDKERIVLDLSHKTKYSLDYDEEANEIHVQMPNASWSTDSQWSENRGKNIVNNYSVEQNDQGVKMILAVADGAKIGNSGLLNADHGKNDRLYIDIIR